MIDSEKSIRSRLLNACLQFMIPTARFLLRGGISCNEFVNLSRLAFVEAAAKDYGVRGRDANSSRIAAVTGLSRRDVARLRLELSKFGEDPHAALSPIGDLLQRWHTDSTFLDPQGNPKALLIEGETPSFKDLVSSVLSDFPVRAMRGELIRSGVAEETSDGRILPVSRQAVPSIAEEKLLTSLTFNLRALVTTIAHNSNPSRYGPGHIERFVNGPKLGDRARNIARTRMRELITQYSIAVDDELRELDEGQKDGSDLDRRVGVGFFYFEE